MKSENRSARPKRPKREKRTDNERQPRLRKIKSTTTILWRYFAIFAFCVIALIAVVCYSVAGNAVLSQARRRIRSVGDDIYNTVCDERLPLSAVEKKIANYAMLDGFDVFVFDGEGNVLLPFNGGQQDVVDAAYKTVVAKTGEWQDGKKTEYSTRDGDNISFNYVACVSVGMVGECKLYVSYPAGNLTNAVRQIELFVLLISLAAFVIAFFISYTLANKLSGPIRDISGTAQKLAAGDYSVQFTSTQYAEIAKLSDTLNYMKDEIRKSDEFRKELVANVSHDLKTPLTMIKAYASMIREISGDDPEKRDKHLQVIIDESDRLTGLVNDILSTSKITSGLEQPNKKVFNLTEMLYSVINKFDYLQETLGYSIMVDVEPNLYTIADEGQIYQVIYNLVSNAINYTGADKTIYISLKFEPEEGRIKFAVRDTGKGISDEEIAHIWDRYYRSKDSHTRPVKGTGLGLNIVKVILQKHSFNFGVNTSPDGSTFYVDFPNG